jgi:cytochrome c551/c552
VPWQEAGFEVPSLEDSVAAIRGSDDAKGTADAERGKQVAERFGCIACHSADGAKEGYSGPTWKGLAGSARHFQDGSSRRADTAYLRDAILEPGKEVVTGYEAGMASYAGVLTELEIDSVIRFIESLR